MRAGKLTKLLTIEQPTNVQSASGQVTASWATFTTWYAELVQVGGGEPYRGRQVHAEANYVADGRYVAGINTRMRATLDSRVFDILTANNVRSRDRELVLDLKERNL